MDSNLIELPCEVRENLVFVHLDTYPELGIDAFLGDYVDEVARPHRTDRMRCVHNSTYTLKSNWKLYAEVDMETLHTPHIHRDSIGEQIVEIAKPNGHWVGVFNRSDQTPALSPDDRARGFLLRRERTAKAGKARISASSSQAFLS